jgi:hypothetical protein
MFIFMMIGSISMSEEVKWYSRGRVGEEVLSILEQLCEGPFQRSDVEVAAQLQRFGLSAFEAVEEVVKFKEEG